MYKVLSIPRHSSLRWLCIAFLLVGLLVQAFPVEAQDGITVVANEHEHVFQESMAFSLSAKATSKITTVKLFFRIAGQTASHKVEFDLEPATEIDLEHVEDMADPSNYEPPMVDVLYWWTIQTEGGDKLKTDPVAFVYEDTRFTWDVLESDVVHLYWHDQDASFGQGFFDAAVAATADLSAEFDVTPDDPIAVVIYNSHQEFMAALQESSAEWTGAVNFGDKGCIAIGLGPMSWMEKVIPHELTHAMLYQVTKPPFGEIPRWLHEGLAMRSEGGTSLEERAALADAIEDNSLISLRVLNSAFGDAREQAILSYAESYSLISYIIEEHGSEKLGELIAVFAVGAHYDDAMLEVFGVDMDGMEDLWRAYIGAPAREGETRATPVPSPTATSESVPTPTPEAASDTTPTVTSEPAPTPTVVAALPTATLKSDEPTEPTATPVPRSVGPCFGAAPMVVLLALVLFPRRR